MRLRAVPAVPAQASLCLAVDLPVLLAHLVLVLHPALVPVPVLELMPVLVLLAVVAPLLSAPDLAPVVVMGLGQQLGLLVATPQTLAAQSGEIAQEQVVAAAAALAWVVVQVEVVL